MVYSSSMVVAELDPNKDVFFYFKRQSMFMLSGFFITAFITIFPGKFLKLGGIVTFIPIFAILIFLIISPIVINSASSWLTTTGSIQPSEFGKPSIIVVLATFLAYIGENPDADKRRVYTLSFGISLLTIFLIIAQGDYGTALIYIMIAISMFLTSNIEMKWLYRVILGGLTAIIAFYLFLQIMPNAITAEKLSRFNYQNPCNDFGGDGYQVCNGLIAINNGRLTGVGFTNSTQKYLHLPYSHTDSIAPIIAEEFGLIGILFVLLMYIIIIYRTLFLAIRVDKVFYRLILIGAGITFFAQVFINLGGITALIPLTGLTLPLISYGGSSVWTSLALIGLILNISMSLNYERSTNIKL